MLHLLDLHRQLCFYLHKTKQFRKSDQLFVSFSPNCFGQVAKVTLAKWITDCISLVYAKKGLDLPQPPQAHSTQSMATSTAFWSRTSIDDVCAAATWTKTRTFVAHYKLDIISRSRASFGWTVLRQVLP